MEAISVRVPVERAVASGFTNSIQSPDIRLTMRRPKKAEMSD
jgi:hypothetical protein|tara:strand:+ start:579 stop:704 length:126 start_codon:yes stop_codon:yes gene_type:complete